MGLPGKRIFKNNKQVALDGNKLALTGFHNGEQFKLYFRRFRDAKTGKVRRILVGPGLRKLTKGG